MININRRLNIDSTPTQSTKHLGPSQKGPPKWLKNTLETVHPDEVGKTGTSNSIRKNGSDIENFDSPAGMDVSYDTELNRSSYFESTSFK